MSEVNWLDNEVFAIRDHESVQLFTEPPEFGRYIAVMARSVELGVYIPDSSKED